MKATNDDIKPRICIEHTIVREVQINYKKRIKISEQLTGPDSVFTFLKRIIPNNSQEHFIAIYLDASNQVIGYSVLFTGLQNMCVVHPRELFQRAIMLGSVSIITAHNHPSGNKEPSKEDINIAGRIQESANILGINYLDNIVFTDSDYKERVGIYQKN